MYTIHQSLLNWNSSYFAFWSLFSPRADFDFILSNLSVRISETKKCVEPVLLTSYNNFVSDSVTSFFSQFDQEAAGNVKQVLIKHMDQYRLILKPAVQKLIKAFPANLKETLREVVPISKKACELISPSLRHYYDLIVPYFGETCQHMGSLVAQAESAIAQKWKKLNLELKRSRPSSRLSSSLSLVASVNSKSSLPFSCKL